MPAPFGPAQPHDLAAVDGQRDAGDGGKATEHGDGIVEVDHQYFSGLGRHALAPLAHCRATLAPYPVASMGRVRRVGIDPRPPDLRWFVRLFGKTLIVIGLLMFGFVAYQLWGTGIEFARAQDRAESEFEELMATVDSASTATDLDVVDDRGHHDRARHEHDGGVDEHLDHARRRRRRRPRRPHRRRCRRRRRRHRSTSLPSASTTAIRSPGWRSRGWAATTSSSPESDGEELKKGPGHYPQTPMPGQLGNAAIAGHRTTYGGPFLEIDELEPGDEIIVTTPYGRFVYLTTTTEIVDADNWQVIATIDPTVATLTLTSCHPVGTASQRIIVHAELDLTQSDTPGPAVFNYGRDAVADATGDAARRERRRPDDDRGGDDDDDAPAATTTPTTIAADTQSSATTTAPAATTVDVDDLDHAAAPDVARRHAVLGAARRRHDRWRR